MYARVISGQIDPEKLKQLVSVLQDSILPCAKLQRGYRGALGLVDHSTGRGTLITLWDSADDLADTESSGYLNRQMARAAPWIAGPAIRETWEVVLQE